ncbi:MAG TPA: tetratricopeptide repeat protein [Gemmatimonadaceae bacterium]|nr:tetratricopeptide repeat protein [Gemmatimonadaceae bacterium]
MTSVGTEASSEDRAETFLEWTRTNSRALSIAGGVILVAACVYWGFAKSRQIQAANAEKALLVAKQSIQAANPQLAQTDLNTVYSRYGSTPAGVEAAMLLAQIDFDAGKYQDGISILEKAAGAGPAATLQSTILSLEGDGYSQMGKPADAAKKYEDAANATRYETEKGFQLAKAARAYQAAGNVVKAKEVWTALATDPKYVSMASEAHVRLGELEVQAAK